MVRSIDSRLAVGGASLGTMFQAFPALFQPVPRSSLARRVFQPFQATSQEACGGTIGRDAQVVETVGTPGTPPKGQHKRASLVTGLVRRWNTPSHAAWHSNTDLHSSHAHRVPPDEEHHRLSDDVLCTMCNRTPCDVNARPFGGPCCHTRSGTRTDVCGGSTREMRIALGASNANRFLLPV